MEFLVAAVDIGPVRGLIVANVVKLAWVIAVTTVILTIKLVMIVGLALLSPILAAEKEVEVTTVFRQPSWS